MELSFCDLRAKEVVNICDGRKLGNIIDLIIDCRYARVIGIVVPFDKGFFSFFKSKQDIFIPWHQICRIGKDVILVDISPNQLPEIYSTSKSNKHQSVSTFSQTQPNNTVIDLGYSKDLNNSPINTPSSLLNNPSQNNAPQGYSSYNQQQNGGYSGFYDNPSYVNTNNAHNQQSSNQNNNNQNNNHPPNNINFNNFTKS